MIAALVLLGLGWNAGLLAGTTMLVDATSSATRACTQGTCDVLVSLAGAGAASAQASSPAPRPTRRCAASPSSQPLRCSRSCPAESRRDVLFIVMTQRR